MLVVTDSAEGVRTAIVEPNHTIKNMVKMLRVLIGEDIELVTQLLEHRPIMRLRARVEFSQGVQFKRTFVYSPQL
jgi:hypothetical protein